jgi:maltose alpha-D-glucosyltransferase/alpha-amylase
VKTCEHFETEVLARYVETQRWYAAKGEPVKRAKLADWALWEAGRASCMLALLEIEGATYFVPLSLAWEDREEERVRALGPAVVAKARQQARVGVIADALADEEFCRAVVEAIGAGREIATAQGKLRFTPTSAFASLAGEDYMGLPVGRPQAQSSNTVVTLGERLFLKGYRCVRPGMNPEYEVGRFLTEQARFANCVPVAGAIEYVARDGTTMTLGLLEAYVSNQGDGWTYTLEYLGRFFDQPRTAVEAPAQDAHGAYLALTRVLGTRTGELHTAFARASGDPAFDPEPVAAEDIAGWKRRVQEEATATLQLLEKNLNQLVLPAREAATELLAQRKQLAARIDSCSPAPDPALKIRCHGDYHLGQVLLAKNDFRIIDFEGEPARPLAERRGKHSPLRDVAGMLRSFDYARWTALRAVTPGPQDHDRLAALALEWRDAARRTFLEGYEEATRITGIYGSFPEVRPLLELFELEKAFYELRYEINNRPGWVLLGIHELTRPAPAA